MDIGVPLRDLGVIDVEALIRLVDGLTEEDWTGNTMRRDILASGAHAASDNIVMKTEWHPSANRMGIQHFEDLIYVWAKEKGVNPADYVPIARQDTDFWPVFTMPDWLKYKDIVEPVVEQAIAPLKTSHGVVTRIALVRLRAGDDVAPHVDGHAMAERAHRIHVSLSSTPSVEYKIDGRKFTMLKGHVYDFNNRMRHSTRNKGKRDRINLFVDYYANPGLMVRNPLDTATPQFMPPTPRIN